MKQVATLVAALPSPDGLSRNPAGIKNADNSQPFAKRTFIVPRNKTSGAIDKSLPGFQNAGTGNGQQFITGQCLSNADCASACCAGSSAGGIAVHWRGSGQSASQNWLRVYLSIMRKACEDGVIWDWEKARNGGLKPNLLNYLCLRDAITAKWSTNTFICN